MNGSVTNAGTINGSTIGALETFQSLSNSGTYTGSAETLALSGTGTPLSNSGTFTANTNTVKFTGAVTSPSVITVQGGANSITYNALSIQPGSGGATTTTYKLPASLTVNGALTVGDGTNAVTIDASTNTTATTLKGDLTLCQSTCTNGVTWTKGNSTIAWGALVGGKSWYDYNSTPKDVGPITLTSLVIGSVTLQTNVSATSFTVSSGTLNLGTGNTLILTGSSTPLSVVGSFTAGTGTVRYTTTSSITIPSTGISYYGLELKPSGAGTPDYTLPSGLTFMSTGGSLIVGDGTNAVNAKQSVSNSSFTFYGTTLTINTNATWTKGSGTLTWAPQAASTWTDNTSGQDIGIVNMSTNTASTITLGSNAKATSITVGKNTTFSESSYVITLTGASAGPISGSTGPLVVANASTTTNIGATTCDATSPAGWAAGCGGASILKVTSTGSFPTNFPSSGFITVPTSGTTAIYSYTGVTATTFTGITYIDGTGNITNGGTVSTSGTFTQSTGTVYYSSTSSLTIPTSSITYNNLTLAPSGAGGPTYTWASSYNTIGGNVTIGDGSNAVTVTEATNNPALTINADFRVRSSGTYTRGSSALTLKGNLQFDSSSTFTKNGAVTWTVAGAKTWTDSTSGQDIGAVTFNGTSSVTLASSTTAAATSATLNNASATFSLGSVGSTFILTGNSTPLTVTTGTFTASGSSTMKYTGTSGTIVPYSTTYYNLLFVPASGTPTYQPTSTTISVKATLTVGSGTSMTLDWATNSPALNIGDAAAAATSGNLTIANNATWTKGTGAITWKPFGSNSTWTDSHSAGLSTTQDIGALTIGSGASTPVVTASTSVAATSVTVNSSHKLSLGSNTLYLKGSSTSSPAATTPLTVSGANGLDAGTGTIYYAGTGSVTVTGSANFVSTQYNALTLAPNGGSNPTYTMPAALGTVAGTMQAGDGTNQVTISWPSASTATLKGDLKLCTNGACNASGAATVTWTKGSPTANTITWSPSGIKNLYDYNGTAQDLGAISLTGGSSTPKVRMQTSTKLSSLTIASSHEYITGANTLTLTGSGTPLTINSGTFTASTNSTTIYNAQAATNITGTTYYNLSLIPGGAAAYTIGYATSQPLTTNNTFTIGDGTNAVTLGNTTYDNNITAGNTTLATNSIVNSSDSASATQSFNTLTINSSATYNGNAETTEVRSTGSPFTLTGTFTPNSDVFKYSTTSNTTIVATPYAGLTMAPSSGGSGSTTAYTLPSSLTTTGAITVGDSTNKVTVKEDSNNTNITLNGNLTLNSPSVWTKGTGTLTWSATGSSKTWTDNNASKQDVGLVVFSGGTSTPKVTLGSSVAATKVQIVDTFDLGAVGYRLTLSGSGSGTSPWDTASGAHGRPLYINGGSFIDDESDVTYTSTTDTDLDVTYPGSLTLSPASGTPVFSLIGTTTVVGSMNIGSSATLDVTGSNYSLNVGKNWANSGTFVPRNGLVTLNTAATAVVTGATDFYDLTISHTVQKEINFSHSALDIIGVTHAFTSTGHSGQPMRLWSDSGGSKWHFHPTGTASVSYSNIKDGGCESGSINIYPVNSSNGGNNDSCWIFNQPPGDPSAGSLGQYKSNGSTTLAAGAWTNETSVVLKGATSDPDGVDTNYACPEVDTVATTFSNTEDGCGSGVTQGNVASYTKSGLADGQYHWQVRIKDDGPLYSGWVQCGTSGSCGVNNDTPTAGADFGVDTVNPVAGSVNDGTTTDITYNDGALNTLSANWSGFSDPRSGIAQYEYAIGTTSGGTDICGWTGNSPTGNGCSALSSPTATSITTANLTGSSKLRTGQPYYFSVRATDNASNVSSVVTSNGQIEPPTIAFSYSPSAVTFDGLNANNSYTDTEAVTITTSTSDYGGYTIRAFADDVAQQANGNWQIGMFNGGTYAAPDAWQSGDTGIGYTSSDTSVHGANIFQSATCPGGNTYAAPGCYSPFSAKPGDTIADRPSGNYGPGQPISNDQYTITFRVSTKSIQPAGTYTAHIVFVATADDLLTGSGGGGSLSCSHCVP